MKKIISATVLALGLAFTVAPAQAYSWPNDLPDLPACAETLPAHQAGNWSDLESECNVSATGDGRLFINLLEVLVDGLGQTTTQARTTIADKDATIAKQKRIIKRLRHRLHHR